MLQKCNEKWYSCKSPARCRLAVADTGVGELMQVVLLTDSGYSAPGTFADDKGGQTHGSSED